MRCARRRRWPRLREVRHRRRHCDEPFVLRGQRVEVALHDRELRMRRFRPRSSSRRKRSRAGEIRAYTSPDACARCARPSLRRRRRDDRPDARGSACAPRRPSAAPAARRWRGNARSRGRSTAAPAPRARSSGRRRRSPRARARASAGEPMSPLASTGIDTARLTAAIVSYSTAPTNRHARVRPCTASAAMPASSAMRAIVSALRCAGSDPVRILSVTGTATARNHRAQDARDERLVGEQRRSGRGIAYLLGGTAHVDVDDLGAALDVVARRVDHHAGIGAGDLHGDGRDLSFVIGAPPRLVRTP